MQGIKISIHYVGTQSDIILISISGYVDTTTCQELAKVLQDLVQKGNQFIVADLRGVTYISSAGWGVFVGEIKKIRDNGGDLKIVQMSPEVYEVFEMLEFNRIINYCDSIEEAVDEYDIIRGINITDTSAYVAPKQEPLDLHYAEAPYQNKSRSSFIKKEEQASHVSAKNYPLIEKIKMIILEDPFASIRDICKQLNTEKYGSVKINWFKMRSILNKQSLGTKEKRHRFYRSR